MSQRLLVDAVVWFCTSIIRQNLLAKAEAARSSPPQPKPIQDVSTRWNSSFYMVSRILEQQQPLCAALLQLKKTDLMPSDAEFSTMEAYVDVMKPLVTITEAIGAEKCMGYNIHCEANTL